MEKFTVYTGTTVPLMNDNIDTDQILPKQFLKLIDKKGFRPDEILGLAFASDAAQEIRDRVKDKIGVDVEIRTFHALGKQIVESAEGKRLKISDVAKNEKAKLSLIASLIKIYPPLEPGTAPLTIINPRSTSVEITSKFCLVTLTSPIWPAIFFPLNTLPGSWHWPVEPKLL